MKKKIFEQTGDLGPTVQKLTTPPEPAVGSQVDRNVRRVIARRDIVGREWTFPRGKRLLGRRETSGWTVWPHPAPDAYICCVHDDFVRELPCSSFCHPLEQCSITEDGRCDVLQAPNGRANREPTHDHA